MDIQGASRNLFPTGTASLVSLQKPVAACAFHVLTEAFNFYRSVFIKQHSIMPLHCKFSSRFCPICGE